MKKIAFFAAFLFSAQLYASGPDMAMPKQISGTPVIGIAMTLSEGMLSATNSEVSIRGFSFRSLDKDKNGFEIPFYLMLNSSESIVSSGFSGRTSINVGAGYRLIRAMLLNEFSRVNVLSGFNAGYYNSWSTGKTAFPIQPKSVSTIPNSFTLGFMAGLEVEIPIGRLFSMQPDAICLAGGVSATISGTIGFSYKNGSLYSSATTFSITTDSFGSSINTLGIRYYF